MIHGYVPPLSETDKAVNKCIDDYLLMERKARAWDKMRAQAVVWHQPEVVAQMDALVHPAHQSAPAKS
jgi:hypothetical protein